MHNSPAVSEPMAPREGAVRVRPSATSDSVATAMRCPEPRTLRERLRAMAADLASAWRTEGVPPAARTSAGLRSTAEAIVRRAQAGPEHVGWTMVTIVSEFWRERLVAGAAGRRLLLLPDCPHAAASGYDASGTEASTPKVCGPDCGIATIWSAARDGGWVVEPVGRAVAGIGGLLTGQYDGVLGIAKLRDLEKAFGMLPAFSLPVAAIPYEPVGPTTAAGTAGGGCAAAMTAAAIDVDWVLQLVGVAGGGSAPVGDYLPLLREAAGMFTGPRLASLAERLQIGPAFGAGSASAASVAPLDATAALAGEFLARGGKFLRPFICLAAHDAVRADAALPCERGDRDAVREVAVAIEVFHKASLVHDDIEDADQMRYGRPTLHVERGVPAAINVGDYLIGLGYRIVAALRGVGSDTVRDLVAILADAHVRLARGQGAELAWRDGSDKRLSPTEALTIYGLKTSPAFEAALAMGVRLANAEPARAAAIGPYALHVGTGFQVLNDLKDWHGDLENDRRVAGDLLGGRPTLMWALALEGLSEAEASRLRELARSAGRPGAPAAEVAATLAEVRRLYERAGVFSRSAAIVREQRTLAAAAAASCRGRQLREVLEFLLDLAVPEPAAVRGDA